MHSCLIRGQCPDVGRKLRQRPMKHDIRPYGIMLLMLCGDVPSNPGPSHWRYSCGTCTKPLMRNQKDIQCDMCDSWYPLNCLPDAIHISTQNKHDYLPPKKAGPAGLATFHRSRLLLRNKSTSDDSNESSVSTLSS